MRIVEKCALPKSAHCKKNAHRYKVRIVIEKPTKKIENTTKENIDIDISSKLNIRALLCQHKEAVRLCIYLSRMDTVLHAITQYTK